MELEASDLKRLIQRYDLALNDGDASAIANLFADNAVMMPPDEPVTTGKIAIFSRHKSLFEQFSLRHSLNSDELVITDHWAFDRGTYEMVVIPTREGQVWKEKANYITIFEKQADGTWKIRSDIWNCSRKTFQTSDSGDRQ